MTTSSFKILQLRVDLLSLLLAAEQLRYPAGSVVNGQPVGGRFKPDPAAIEELLSDANLKAIEKQLRSRAQLENAIKLAGLTKEQEQQVRAMQKVLLDRVVKMEGSEEERQKLATHIAKGVGLIEDPKLEAKFLEGMETSDTMRQAVNSSLTAGKAIYKAKADFDQQKEAMRSLKDETQFVQDVGKLAASAMDIVTFGVFTLASPQASVALIGGAEVGTVMTELLAGKTAVRGAKEVGKALAKTDVSKETLAFVSGVAAGQAMIEAMELSLEQTKHLDRETALYDAKRMHAQMMKDLHKSLKL